MFCSLTDLYYSFTPICLRWIVEKHEETVLGIEHLVQIHFWDFGGQLIFYNTHPTYMSERCLYVLVFDLSIGLQGEVQDPDINTGVNNNRTAIGRYGNGSRRGKGKRSDSVLWQKHPTNRKIQKATWQHKNTNKNFDCTTIAERLRTVSWSENSYLHVTGVVKPVYGITIVPAGTQRWFNIVLTLILGRDVEQLIFKVYTTLLISTLEQRHISTLN